MMEFCARNSVSANIACISTNLECECTYTGLWQIAARGGRGRERFVVHKQPNSLFVRYTPGCNREKFGGVGRLFAVLLV